MSSVTAFPLRLEPGADLVESIKEFVKTRKLRAAFIMTCVGSLTNAVIRLAHADRSVRYIEQFMNPICTG